MTLEEILDIKIWDKVKTYRTQGLFGLENFEYWVEEETSTTYNYWSYKSSSEEISFEEVLSKVSPEKRLKLLYHLDLFK